MFPPQSESNLGITDGKLDNPVEHFMWSLTHLPGIGGIPTMGHPEMYHLWCERFADAGFVHGPSLAALADENGFIHVSQIPKQTKRFRRPARGPQNGYNMSGKWVDMDTPDPDPVVLPDAEKLTMQENYVMIDQWEAKGLLKRYEIVPPDEAQVIE